MKEEINIRTALKLTDTQTEQVKLNYSKLPQREGKHWVQNSTLFHDFF